MTLPPFVDLDPYTRPTKDDYFMRMALLVAERATCRRRRVGCVLINARGHVLATGYNGREAGAPHCNEPTGFDFVYENGIDPTRQVTGQATGQVRTYANSCPGWDAPSGERLDACDAIHAEQNALLQCGDVWAIETCYVTTLPCVPCAKLLLNTGCRRIAYISPYGSAEAVARLWADRALERIVLRTP